MTRTNDTDRDAYVRTVIDQTGDGDEKTLATTPEEWAATCLDLAEAYCNVVTNRLTKERDDPPDEEWAVEPPPYIPPPEALPSTAQQHPREDTPTSTLFDVKEGASDGSSD